ncbi:MAG TPA: phosphoribosyltransferase family protein [Egibacteraceae bacterium]|nr:phosphoribosyltransferase family protein [Egibacteraceae bacterium]
MSDAPLRLAWPRAAIRARVAELGTEITARYAGQELMLVGVLNGAAVFLADLVRCLELPVRIDFLALRPVDPHAVGEAPAALLKDLELDIGGRQVLLVEDVVHSGVTLAQVLRLLQARDPASLRVCTLLDRTVARVTALPVDHVGFRVGLAPLVGYGLDLGGHFRALPDLWEVTDEHALLRDPAGAAESARRALTAREAARD